MHNGIGHRQGARTKPDHGYDLGGDFQGRPYPDFLARLSHIGPELVQLDMLKLQALKEMVMQLSSLQTRTRQPRA